MHLKPLPDCQRLQATTPHQEDRLFLAVGLHGSELVLLEFLRSKASLSRANPADHRQVALRSTEHKSFIVKGPA